MATINISQNEFDDFMDEADTLVSVSITVMQSELDSSVSLSAFGARATQLGYGTFPEGEPAPLHWTDRLDMELEAMQPLDFGKGWAGRSAR